MMLKFLIDLLLDCVNLKYFLVILVSKCVYELDVSV